ARSSSDACARASAGKHRNAPRKRPWRSARYAGLSAWADARNPNAPRRRGERGGLRRERTGPPVRRLSESRSPGGPMSICILPPRSSACPPRLRGAFLFSGVLLGRTLRDLLRREVFLVRGDGPHVAERIDHGARAIPVELVLHRPHDLRAGVLGLLHARVDVLDVQADADGRAAVG